MRSIGKYRSQARPTMLLRRIGPKKRESWLTVRLSPSTKYEPAGTTQEAVPSASRGTVGTGAPSTPLMTYGSSSLTRTPPGGVT